MKNQPRHGSSGAARRVRQDMDALDRMPARRAAVGLPPTARQLHAEPRLADDVLGCKDHPKQKEGDGNAADAAVQAAVERIVDGPDPGLAEQLATRDRIDDAPVEHHRGERGDKRLEAQPDDEVGVQDPGGDPNCETEDDRRPAGQTEHDRGVERDHANEPQ